MSNASTLEFSAGDRVAVAKVGAAEVSEVHDDKVTLLDREGSLDMPIERFTEVARPLVDQQTAAQVRSRFGTLGTPHPGERPYQRKKAYRKVWKGNDFEEMATTLEGIYRHPDPEYPEKRFQERLEHAVLQEMAWVLDEPADKLIREARQATDRAIPAVDRSDEIAQAGAPPTIDGLEALGTFASDGALLAGETSQYLISVRPGAWYAYARPSDEIDAFDMLLCVHVDCVDQLDALLKHRVEMKEAYAIDGATSWVVDRVLTEAPEFHRALFDNEDTLVEYAGWGPRGARVYAGGDGSGAVQIAGVGEDGAVRVLDPEISDSGPGRHGEIEPTAGEVTCVVLDIHAY